MPDSLLILLKQFDMVSIDFASQFFEAPRHKGRSIFGSNSFNPSEAEKLDIYLRIESSCFLRRRNKKEESTLGFFHTALIGIFVLLVLILPTKSIKINHNFSSPSSYEAHLNNYLTILKDYSDPSNLPQSYEDNLKEAAKNALYLASETKTYYPDNEELLKLTKQIENQVGEKFPDLLANR